MENRWLLQSREKCYQSKHKDYVVTNLDVREKKENGEALHVHVPLGAGLGLWSTLGEGGEYIICITHLLNFLR